MHSLTRVLVHPRCLPLLLAALVLGCGGPNGTNVELAEYYYSRPDYEQALAACDLALKEQPSAELESRIRVIRGRCFLDRAAAKGGDYDRDLLQKAIAEFSNAIELHDNADARHGRRIAARYYGDDDLAARDYDRIRELDPAYQSAYVNERPDPTRLLEERKSQMVANAAEVPVEEPSSQPRDEGLLSEDDDVPADLADTSPSGSTPPVATVGPSPSTIRTPDPTQKLKDRTAVSTVVPRQPSNRYSDWLSQHTFGRVSPTANPTGVFTDRAPSELIRDFPSEPSEDETRETDADGESDAERPFVHRSPLNWPPMGNGPQAGPSPPTTGIGGPTGNNNSNWSGSPSRYTGIVAPTPPTGVVGPRVFNQGAGSGIGSVGIPTTGVPTTAGVPTAGFPLSGVPSLGVPTTGLSTQLPSTGTGRTDGAQGFSGGKAIGNPFLFIPRGPVGPKLPERPNAPRQHPQFQTSPLAAPLPRK